MIRIYITDYSKLRAEDVAKVNNDQLTPSSYAARRALNALYSVTYNEKMPRIKYAEGGKPYFADNPHGVYFNISHTDSYAVAVLTDEGECGIDIEGERDSVKAARIDKRYLLGIDMEMPPFATNPEILFDRLDTPIGGRDLCEMTAGNGYDMLDEILYPKKGRTLSEYPINANLLPIARWTVLEAVLKADGRGFVAYKEAQELVWQCAARHYLLSDGEKRLFLSVAVK